jgi:hypothetical protein
MPTPLRILMHTSDGYEKYAHTSLRLLQKYWPEHPGVDLLHYSRFPTFGLGEVRDVEYHHCGQQHPKSWSNSHLRHLLNNYSYPYVLLMLDDYALCAPVDPIRIATTLTLLVNHPGIGCVHLTTQPVKPLPCDPPFQTLPQWAYSINSQAAIWDTNYLIMVLDKTPDANIWDFEHIGSRWWNQYGRVGEIRQADMKPPAQLCDFADTMDKSDWVLPYNNLSRQGRLDERHRQFLLAEGFNL